MGEGLIGRRYDVRGRWLSVAVVAAVALAVLAAVPRAVVDVRAVGGSCRPPGCTTVSGELERGRAAGRRVVRRAWHVDPPGPDRRVSMRTGPLAGSLDRHVGEVVTAEMRGDDVVAIVADGDRTWAFLRGWSALTAAGVVLAAGLAVLVGLVVRRRRGK